MRTVLASAWLYVLSCPLDSLCTLWPFGSANRSLLPGDLMWRKNLAGFINRIL